MRIIKKFAQDDGVTLVRIGTSSVVLPQGFHPENQCHPNVWPYGPMLHQWHTITVLDRFNYSPLTQNLMF